MRVDIIQFPQTAVAALTHQGLPERINDTAARFIQWRKATGGSPVATSRTMAWRRTTPPRRRGAAFRFTLCGSVEAPVAEDNEWGVKNALIPAGRCAVVRHRGSRPPGRLCPGALPRLAARQRRRAAGFSALLPLPQLCTRGAHPWLVTDIYLPLA